MPYCDIEQLDNPAEGLMIFDTEFHCLRIHIQGKWHCLYQQLNGPGAELNVTGWVNPTYDDDANTSITVDSKENILVTMVTEDGEIRLTKFDNKGNILWTILEEERNYWEHGSVALDQEDYIFTVASSSKQENITFNGTSLTNTGFFITKTSPDGSNSDLYTLPNANIKDMAIDHEGNVLFSFEFNGNVMFNGITLMDNNSDSVIKAGIAKLDNNLNELWVEVIEVNAEYEPYLQPLALAVDWEGNVLLASTHENGVEGGFPTPLSSTTFKTNNLFTAKFAALDGEPIWIENHASDLIFKNIDIHYSDVYSQGNAIVTFVETDNINFYPPDISNGKIINYNALLGYRHHIHELPGTVFNLQVATNNKRRQLAATYIPDLKEVDYLDTPAKLLVYDYNNLNSPKINTVQTFRSPYSLSFNEDGSKIFGIAKGPSVGNVTIDQGPNSENHIIYKVYND